MFRVTKDLALRLHHAVEVVQMTGQLAPFPIPEVVVTAARPEHGDYATPLAMQLAKAAKLPPPQLATLLIDTLKRPEYLSEVTQAGGFINFRLDDAWLKKQVDVILAEGADLAHFTDFEGRLAQVECVSANPTGPITVGRIRGGVIGDTLARLMRTMGYDVTLEYYFNNAGRQMRLLGESVRARYLELLGLSAPFPEEGYKGDYIRDVAQALHAEKGDSLRDEADPTPFKDFAEAYIDRMQRTSLRRVGIVFQNYFNENSLYDSGAVWDTLEDLRSKGLIYEAVQAERDEDADTNPDQEEREAAATGTATWLRMRQLRGIKKDVAVVKSSGEPTYLLPDIAYHVDKLKRGFNPAVNLLGADHQDEAKNVRAAVAALGYPAENIAYIIHQFVSLIKDGQPVKMSTREGNFITLDELIDATSPDAVRYFILARSPNTEVVFDLDLAVKNTNENPVYYIQNAHVRCASIAREAEARGLSWDGGDVSLLGDPLEMALIRKLVELPEVIELAVTKLEPHLLAFWTHEQLARTFHPVYEEIRALHSTVPEDLARARLKLYAAAQLVLARSLDLMGMTAPNRM